MLVSIVRQTCTASRQPQSSCLIRFLGKPGSALHNVAAGDICRTQNTSISHTLHRNNRSSKGILPAGPHDLTHHKLHSNHRNSSKRRDPRSSNPLRDSGGQGEGRGITGRNTAHATRRRRKRPEKQLKGDFNVESVDFVKEVAVLGRDGRWFKALELYKQASEDGGIKMTPFMYNATIAAVSKRGRWNEALAVMEDMRSAGFAPDRYTFNAVIQACAHGNESSRAFSLFEDMKAAGIASDAFTYNHLLTACRCGEWERALELVKEMEKAGLEVGAISFNAVIVACGSALKPDKAVGILQDMRSRNITRTEGSFCAAITACGKVGQWDRALSLLDEMQLDDLVPNRYCFDAAITACTAAGKWQEALALFRRVHLQGEGDEAINKKQIRKVLEVCARAGAIDQARQLVADLNGMGHNVADNHLAVAERKASKRGKPGGLDEARVVLSMGPASVVSSNSPALGEGISHDGAAEAQLSRGGHKASGSSRPRQAWAPPYTPKKFVQCVKTCTGDTEADVAINMLTNAVADPNIKVTMYMYQSVLHNLARQGRSDDALRVLELIRGARLAPSQTCLALAIRACGRARPSDHVRAVELLDQMDSPHSWGYAAAISACTKAQEWEKGLSLLERMISSGLQPNLLCYSSALEACFKTNPSRWEKAIDLVGRMKAEGIKLDSVSYNTAIRACVAAQQVEAARTLLDEMVNAGHVPLDDLKQLAAGSS